MVNAVFLVAGYPEWLAFVAQGAQKKHGWELAKRCVKELRMTMCCYTAITGIYNVYTLWYTNMAMENQPFEWVNEL